MKPATAFGNRCPQPALNKPGALFVFSELPTSEDCLNLNIWAPAKGKKHSVMLWIHGGGFGFGSSADPNYDGSSLARKEGVILVSINHRLNGFGYFNLGPDAAGDFDANPGQQDIVLALQWVRKNIARFGGDPGNVTVFGQSGGGGKISSLLAMPAAKGLFAKAIIESGSDPYSRTVEESIAVRDKVLAAAGLKPGEVRKLRDLPTEKLTELFAKVGILSYGPVLDAVVQPTHPYGPVPNPVSADVPLLLGTTRDEATSVLAADPNWPMLDDARLGMFAMALTGPDFAQEAVALYRKLAPADRPMHLLARIMTDKMFTQTAAVLADRKAAQPAPVYKYRIDWRSPVLGGDLRSPHGVEIPFLFDSLKPGDRLVGNGASQARMTELVRSSFAAFARSGNPSISGHPAWPRYDSKLRATYIFDDPPSVIHDPDPELRAFWNKVDAAKNR
ncbi:MAG: carboxylesterase/lipase family protein [Sphingomonadales bacterium]|nr:MAG: carboxylesterase/lipase family protein [Sphingomonadales bacterium]